MIETDGDGFWRGPLKLFSRVIEYVECVFNVFFQTYWGRYELGSRICRLYVRDFEVIQLWLHFVHYFVL